ncbi:MULTISPECIES: oligosaccharide flippase family protein [Vibrio]|uniref:oligosaccharide flippase family protein n=1 Tax=Vibrio TaxID=662 RepID=UPI0020C1B121|nr:MULTISPECIES: oligosaccharide flippase family protein [Vibrio]MDW2326723.1 oligosaccharide flippase family protein [Vibrio sp. 1401]
MQVVKNIGYLFIVNFANYVIPLVLVPYAISTIGVDGFGKFSIALAIFSYGVLITEFGMNLTVTKILCQSASEDNDDIISAVVTIKIFIYAAVTTVLITGCLIFKSDDLYLYLSLSLYLFGFTFSPLWYFQYKENMKVVTLYNVIPKLIVLPLIFVFVKSKDDLFLYGFIWSFSFFLSGIIGLVILFQNFQFKLPRIEVVKRVIYESLPIFFSQVSVKIYSTSNVLVAGLMIGDVAAGIFAAVEKLIRGGVSLLSPIHSVLYPRLNIKLKENTNEYCYLVKMLVTIQFFLTAGVYIAVNILNDHILLLFFGEVIDFTSVNFSIVYLLLIIIPMSNVFGTLILLPNGENKGFFKVLSISAALHLVLLPVVTYFWKLKGVFLIYTFTESLVLLLLVLLVKEKKILTNMFVKC